jgi:1-acyl-sn-glycerol-3-phosphate acyltransferase
MDQTPIDNQVNGRKASPDEAPIVVSNHISFVETIYLPARLLSMAVSRLENSYIPVRTA